MNQLDTLPFNIGYREVGLNASVTALLGEPAKDLLKSVLLCCKSSSNTWKSDANDPVFA